MLRPLAIGSGLLHAFAPRRVVDAAERLAFENPDAGRLRPWTLPLARLEGLAFAALVARRVGLPEPFKAPIALLGFMLAAIPRQMLSYGLAIAYENPEDIEVKSWVGPLTRVLGVVYMVLVLVPIRVDAPEDE